MNFVIPGALTKRPGTTLYLGSTVSGRITSGTQFERLNGASYVVVSANTNAYTVTNTFTPFATGLLNGGILDYSAFVDRLFFANGQDFLKFDGSNVFKIGLPSGASGFGATAAVGGSMISAAAAATTYFNVGYSYINDRGYIGPSSSGFTVVLNGITFNSILYYGMSTITGPGVGYGVTAIQLYRSAPNGTVLAGTTIAPSGTTTVTDIGWAQTAFIETDDFHFTLAPKYLELYNNQLFMAGFSNALSTVVWSRIGEPEGIEPDFNAEFRTNDGDRVTGLKSYNGSIVVSKERSFHRITGDDPSNFLLTEISDQYGCISNRAMVVYNDTLLFLDRKGVVEFNGANIGIISTKIEPTFNSMNIDSARENAQAIHYRESNEVWFAIPTNGATMNNTVVVYDYLAQAWTTYTGNDISALFMARGRFSKDTPFYAGYTGFLANFGSSIASDLGRAITCVITPPYLSPRGQTNECQFRRFYLNVDPIMNAVDNISINLRTNFGSSIQATRTMSQAPFQNRIDFGLPGRSIQTEIIHSSATLPLTVFGMAISSRLQREV